MPAVPRRRDSLSSGLTCAPQVHIVRSGPCSWDVTIPCLRLTSVPADASVLSTSVSLGVEIFSTPVAVIARVQMNISDAYPTRPPFETVTKYFHANP